MAQTLKLKRSAVSGRVPTTSDLDLGEIAINTYDGKIFIKKNDGSDAIVTFEAGGSTNAGTIEEDSFTGNGSTTGFTLTTAPSSEENVLVFIDATFQNRDSFTLSGTTITFDTAPDNGSSVRVYHVIPGTLDDGILTVTKFAASAIVTEAEGISSNDNDTTIPTSAAVKDYVDTQVATVDTLPEVLANGNTTGGTDIAVSAADDITFTDTSKAIFGTDSDLELYHNGSNAFLTNSTGDLYIQDTNGSIRIRPKTGESGIDVLADGAVNLYYDGSSKLATTNTGIDVTGNITVSGTVDGRDIATDGTKLDGIEANATADQTQSDINALGITQVGTISSGTWQGTAIASAYLDSDTAHLSGTQTFTGIKTFNDIRADIFKGSSASSNSFLDFDDDNASIGTNGVTLGAVASMDFIIDTNNNGTGDVFVWGKDDTNPSGANYSELMRLDNSGNLTLSGTVDGRDVATDGTKLDTIATNADVTPSWVPSSDPSYLTSSSTQSKYLRSDTADSASGTLTFSGTQKYEGASQWIVSSSDAALQRADARDDDTNKARLHWYGTDTSGSNTNFRHAWYDGSAYVNVDVASQVVSFSGGLSATSLNTGQGAYELYAMNQNVRTTDAVTFATVNTGQGATEVHLMNQNVRTTDSPTFNALTIDSTSSTHNLYLDNRDDFLNTTNDAAIWITSGASGGFKSGEGAHLVFEGRQSTRNFYFKVGNVTAPQHIMHNNGKVGIGTGDITPSSTLQVSGSIQGTSFSDGTISGITFIDEDSFSTNSATRVPTQQSIKAYVDAQVAGVVDSAPAALNTLNELAAALGDDASFSTTTSDALGNRLRVDTASQGLTGTQQANAITNLGITATKAELNLLDGVTATTTELNYVDGVTSNIQTQLNAKYGSGSNVSLGTISSGAIDSLTSSADIPQGSTANLYLVDTRSLAANTGGSIVFSSYYQGTTAVDGGSYIKGYKENATSGDYGYGLKFGVRENGQGTTDPVFTLNSSGNAIFTGTISSGAITSTGNSTFSGVIGVGGTSTNSSYGVYLQNNKWYATQYSSSHDVVRMNANTAGGLDIYNQTDSGFANVRAGSYNIGSTTVIDSSGNLTNIGTISSGDITTTGIQMGSGTSNDIQADGKTAFFGSAMFGTAASSNTPLKAVHIKGSGAQSIRIEDTASSNQIYDITSTYNGGLTIVDTTGGITPLSIAHTTGHSTFSGTVTSPRLRLTATDDASPTSTAHAFQIGDSSSANIIIDDNEIMARDNGSPATLNLQVEGGDIAIRAGLTGTTNLKMSGTTFMDHSRNLSNIGTISSGAITSSGRVTTGEDLRFSSTPRIRADNEINFLTNAGAAQVIKVLGAAAQTAYNGNSASDGMFNALNGYAVGTGNGTTVIDSLRNLTNIGNITSSGTIRQTVNNVGIPTNYGQHTMEATDAQMDLVSSSAGTWGSAINFVEGASTSANTDIWSIARKTTGGAGDSSLNFNFGTGNQHDNNNKVKFASSGTVSIDTGTTSGTFLSLTRNGGTEIGRIAYSATDNISIYGTNNHAGINFIASAIIPMQGSSELDDTIALGDSTRNFSEVFAKGMTVGSTQVIDASRNIKNIADYHSDGRLQAASVHGQNTHIGGELLFEITDHDDSTSIKRKFGYNDSNSNFSKSTDSTAPASGVFDVYEYASPQWGPKIPIDDETEIIFECWAKHVSGDDTTGNFYVGGSFYDGSDTYLGNNNRYWGANGDALDANSGNDTWRHIKGVLRGDAIRAQSATSTAQFVQLLTLFNYNTGSNWSTNPQTTRYCGFKFYRSKKTVSSIYLKTSNGTTNYQDSNFQSTYAATANLLVGPDQRLYANAVGTNTTPQFTFTGDTDTGFAYIAADSPGIIAGGSRKFYLNSTTAYFQNLSGGLQMSAHIDMNNNNISGVNSLSFDDPGPDEGLTWSNIKIYESPNDLTTNSAGNFQVVYGSTRRLTVNSTGADVNGVLEAGASDNISMSSDSNGQLKIMGNGYTGAIALDGTGMHLYHNSASRNLTLGTNETARIIIGATGGVSFNDNDLTSCGNITADQGTFKSDSEALRVSSLTNGVGATILFSDNGSPPALTSGQRGYLEYYHGDSVSYGSGNSFVLTGTEATMTVLADGKLMFKEGLYTKPSSGTGAGSVVIDSSGNLHGNGVYVGSWANSTTSTVGRIGKVSDRVAGSITNQIGGSTSAKWEVVDYGWTKVLLSVTNAGLTVSNGGISCIAGEITTDAGVELGVGTGAGGVRSGYLAHLKSTGDAALLIEADTDNVTETDNAFIRLEQDGGAVAGRMGYRSGENALEIMNEYNAELYFGTTNVLRGKFTGGGDFVTSGNITAYGSVSDIRRKENIEVIPNALEKVKTLDGITFNFKDRPEEKMTGVIAQQVMEVLPEAVYEHETMEKEQTYAVHYGNMVGLLIESIKEQQKQIDELKEEVSSLRSKN